MLGLRMPELLLILLVIVLLFGAKKLPELGESLGKGIRAFRKASDKGFASDETDATAKGDTPPQLPDSSSAAAPRRARDDVKKA